MLPKMTGVELMKKVRGDTEFQKLPIIVFSNTYLTNMVQDAWKAGATKCLSKANCSPKQLIDLVRATLLANGGGDDQEPEEAEEAPAATPAATLNPRPLPDNPKATATKEADAKFQAELRGSFMERLPATLAGLRALLQSIITAENEAAR